MRGYVRKEICHGSLPELTGQAGTQINTKNKIRRLIPLPLREKVW